MGPGKHENVGKSQSVLIMRGRVPHRLNDPTQFGSLGDLCGVSRVEGYQGGLRLMQATCKAFFEYHLGHILIMARDSRLTEIYLCFAMPMLIVNLV
jgi:hypothetical protein